MNQRRAVLFALGAVSIWSTVATAFKIALKDVAVIPMLFYASVASVLVLSVVVIMQGSFRQLREWSAKSFLNSSLLGLLNPFLYYLVLFKAYELLPAQEAQPLNYTWPLVLAALSSVFLKQRLSIMMVVALLVSFFGVTVIALRGDLQAMQISDDLGVALAVGSSLIWSSYWILNMRSKEERVLKLLVNFFFGMLYVTIALIVTGESLSASTSGVLASVYAGAFEMGVPFVLWINALKLARSTASIANLVYISPFLSLIFISSIIGEVILPSTIVGLLLIVAGIFLQQFAQRKHGSSLQSSRTE